MSINRPSNRIEKDNSKKGLIASIATNEQDNDDINVVNNDEAGGRKLKKKMKQKMFYCSPEIEAAILIRKAKTGQDISEIICEAIEKNLEIEIKQARNLRSDTF